ncbi:hypothetical protein OSB04_017865 [Centaurea solstitialis]|uniref:Receptor-like serine/threonine-protein kinase n=1 Tax=Centaurea solstitialis TaxID=347529 RepID=A0AA38WIR9_9ASTR|nr:hypothetical protein OSB04_017865 [Centaurea solstitialis]
MSAFSMNQTMILLPLVTFFFLMLVRSSSSVDTISISQNITDGVTIVSANEIYEFGFFSTMVSKTRYLGVWFRNTTNHIVIWVANRETPITDTSGMVTLDSHGILSLVDGGSKLIWRSSNSSSNTSIVNKPVVQLLDTGNLVIKDGNAVGDETFIWQSFDYPGDILISGMKMGKNLVTGREMYLTSWKSEDDPTPGEYSVRYSIAKGEYPQVYMKRSSDIVTRFGPYNGISFAIQPPAEVEMVSNERETYFVYNFNSTGSLLLLIAMPRGEIETWQLNLRTREWLQLSFTLPKDDCDKYGLCGPYGSCSTETFPSCGCLKGFEISNPKEWSARNWTSGCRRSRALDCGPGEGFHKFSGMKLPDTQSGNAVFVANISLQECEVACKNNCLCTAYANPNFTQGGVGCLQWFGDLIDVRTYQQHGQDLFVRLAASEFLDLHSSSNRKKKQVVIRVILPILAGLVLLGLILALYIRSKKGSDAERQGKAVKVFIKDHHSSSKEEGIEVPLFSLAAISRATDKFSINNKLGEGGFGPVYKFMLKTIPANGNIQGVLEEGQEIAVKRLSKSSRQGLDEFKNEVICIAKLQHRNLVKLLGYCIQGEETMLIYEYMSNKSLDRFIFDDSRKSLLDWPCRLNIIHGIAGGLLYLHQDSRLRVVHRDLKAGNILLDNDMNPKISDFGLARMFEGHESEANTMRVVGTLGYISPEYAVNGHFSVKSDIFSFGVLVLEIVSGKKNRGFVHEDHHDHLLGHAWRLYKEGKSLDLIDTSLVKSCSGSEVLRSIHIALLCVQQRPEDRPNIRSVVRMLGSEGSLPSPQEPGYFVQGNKSSSTSSVPSSVNAVTLSRIEAR